MKIEKTKKKINWQLISWWFLVVIILLYQYLIIPQMEEKRNINMLQTFMIGYAIGNENINYDIIPYTQAAGKALGVDSAKIELVLDWYYTPEDTNANSQTLR